MLAIVILVMTPVLVVGGFHIATRTHFVTLESSYGLAPHPVERFRAFEHAYASGVMAATLGDGLADLSGRLIELVGQNECAVREANLINDTQGRALAHLVRAQSRDDWRLRFARMLFLALREPTSDFSIDPARDARIRDRCRSG